MSINQIVCSKTDLIENSGICALVNGKQIAIFYIPRHEQQVFAISNWDPIGKANVMSRGIVGNLGDAVVVASPLYKQHFDLKSGNCLEDERSSVKVYPASLKNDKVVII